MDVPRTGYVITVSSVAVLARGETHELARVGAV